MKLKGPWDRAAVREFLVAATCPLRLACIGTDGFPRVVSLWYRYADGRFYAVSHRDSHLVRLLGACDRVGFEVSLNDPPYRGVRGQGIASLAAGAGGSELETLLERYLGGTESDLARWLLSRREEETLIVVEPQRLSSWDYTARMSAGG